MEEYCQAYASALYSLLEEKERPSYQNALSSIGKDFAENPSFLRLLSSYQIGYEEKKKMLERIYGPLGSPRLLPFLCLLVKKHRIASFDDIESCFASLCDEASSTTRGIVYSVSPLSREELTSIEASLGKKTSAEVKLRNVVDPSLLGGVKVSLGDKVYDGSLKGKLDNLAKQLKGGSL